MIHKDVQSAVRSLRGCFTDLLASVGTDPRRPQELSRRIGVDKTLAWKISRVIAATETDSALHHMPGDAAFDILLSALQRAGARPTEIVRAREVLKSYRDAIEQRVGDRPTLEIVVDALPSQERDRLALSRKLAFRGNSGIWGVQARVRVNTIILKPSDVQPAMIDSILVGGWVDFRRMRRDAQWTLFRRRSFRNAAATTTGERPLDPEEPAAGPMLMRRFCTPGMPEIAAVDAGESGVAYELGPGPVGNSGMFTCFFGSIHERLGSRYAEREGEQAEFYAMVSAPAETLLFDLILHESLVPGDVGVSVYGVLANAPGYLREKDALPIEPQRHDVGGRPPMLTTPLVPEYADAIDHAFRQARWDPARFGGLRYTLEYPPFPSTMAVRFPLEPRQQ